MKQSEIEIKALEFYRDDVARRFKKADAIISGDWTAQLLAVQKEIRALMPDGRAEADDLPELKRLWRQEKHLKDIEKRSFDLVVTREWANLKDELSAVDRVLLRRRFIARRQAKRSNELTK